MQLISPLWRQGHAYPIQRSHSYYHKQGLWVPAVDRLFLLLHCLVDSVVTSLLSIKRAFPLSILWLLLNFSHLWSCLVMLCQWFAVESTVWNAFNKCKTEHQSCIINIFKILHTSLFEICLLIDVWEFLCVFYSFLLCSERRAPVIWIVRCKLI